MTHPSGRLNERTAKTRGIQRRDPPHHPNMTLCPRPGHIYVSQRARGSGRSRLGILRGEEAVPVGREVTLGIAQNARVSRRSRVGHGAGARAGLRPEVASWATWRRPGGLLAAGEGGFEENDDLVDQRTPVGDRRLDELVVEGGRHPDAQVLEDFLLALSDLHAPRVADDKDHYKTIMSLNIREAAVILLTRPTPAGRPPFVAAPHRPAPPLDVDPYCRWSARCPMP